MCIRDRTLAFFKEQGVTLKVISGDNPVTVSAIARRVELEGAENYVDASTLKTEAELREALERCAVFGRVSPEQKKQMVRLLKEQGHTVAMTGDGVNDVLALREADCSVAMASGSDAARNVSQLTLLDSNFASMPQVVFEGRRSINNLQRSASLFLVKTLYSILLALIFLVMPYPYPFEPIQLTLVSSLTIGFPSFVLALEPNKNRVQGNFLRTVISRSVPGAVTIVLSVVALCLLSPVLGVNWEELSTLCVLSAAFTGCMIIFRLCRPFTLLRKLLFAAILLGLVISVLGLFWLFSLVPMSGRLALYLLGIFAVDLGVFAGINKAAQRPGAAG